jgi:predicted RNase H-like nuclease (RuvC/YqgF family)
MVNFVCPRCGFSADHKSHIIVHIERKKLCKITNLDVSLTEYREQILDRTFFKIYKFKKEIEKLKENNDKLKENNDKLKENNDKLKENNDKLKTENNELLNTNKEIKKQKIKEKPSENDKFNQKYKKLEETVNLMTSYIDSKVLGNTDIKTIRSLSRKKYKDFSKDMKCVHCNHLGSTQVCHIKAISDFNKLSTVEEINHISNLIGLCPNCHIDLDKHKKFEITRTATLHSLLVKLTI